MKKIIAWLVAGLFLVGGTLYAANGDLIVNGKLGMQDSGTKTCSGGLVSEAGAQLIEFGMNEGIYNRFGGAYVPSAQGGLLRVETRSGQPLFQFWGRQAGVSAEMSPLMAVLSSGYVGIGTQNPTAALHIVGGPGPTEQLFIQSGWAPTLNLNNTGTGGRQWVLQSVNPASGPSGAQGRFRIYDITTMAERVSIDSTGNVGIGMPSPSYLLQLGIDSAGKPNGGSWANTSDKRLKKNITPLSGALDKILKLNPVEYEWINPEEHGAKEKEIRTGFIAQEIEKEFPLWVNEYSPNEKSKDAKLIPAGDKAKDLRFPNDTYAYLVQAIKEQQKQIEALKAEIAALKQIRH